MKKVADIPVVLGDSRSIINQVGEIRINMRIEQTALLGTVRI